MEPDNSKNGTRHSFFELSGSISIFQYVYFSFIQNIRIKNMSK